jgi:hypothetical protein
VFGSDDAPLVESLVDISFVRGSINGRSDGRFVRGRVAMLLWLPGLFLLTMVAIWLQKLVILAVGIPVLLVGLWLFAERSAQIAAFARRR